MQKKYITHKRALKFLTVPDSRGHFRYSNKQPLKENVHFFEKSKYCTFIITFLQKISGVSTINHGCL